MPFEIAVACPRDAPCNGRLEYTGHVLADPPPEVALDPVIAAAAPRRPWQPTAQRLTAALDAFIRTPSREDRPPLSSTRSPASVTQPARRTIRPAAPPLQRN